MPVRVHPLFCPKSKIQKQDNMGQYRHHRPSGSTTRVALGVNETVSPARDSSPSIEVDRRSGLVKNNGLSLWHGTSLSKEKFWVARRPMAPGGRRPFRRYQGLAQMNLFDVLIPVALLTGLVRGRQHGISVELIRTLKWIALVVTGAAFAPQAGQEVSRYGFFDFQSACLMAYLGIALAVFLFFSMLERRLTKHLQKGDAFGRAEYYLGMGAGLRSEERRV